MPVELEIWDGDEWKAHVLRLLHDRHGVTNVQKVPARHRGDCGIDAFCLSDRVVYQSYAVLEPCSVADRAEKQRDKITIDIGKFTDPAKGASELFKGHPISRWILVVPLHDSREVNRHAIRKQGEVRALGLTHVASDFEILIHDRGDFDEQSYARRRQERARIRALTRAPTDLEVAELEAQSSDLVANLRRKLAKRLRSDEPVEDASDAAIREYIASQNALESLRLSAPEAHEKILAFIGQRMRRLVLVGGRRGHSPAETLEAEIDGFVAGLRERLPLLDPETLDQLAIGTISQWLMLCPLDFD